MKSTNQIVPVGSADSSDLISETVTKLDNLTEDGYVIAGVVPAHETRPALILLSKDADNADPIPADPTPPVVP